MSLRSMHASAVYQRPDENELFSLPNSISLRIIESIGKDTNITRSIG